MPQRELHIPITSAVPTCRPEESAGNVLTLIQSTIDALASIDYIYVLEGTKLVGVFSIHELFSTPTTTKVKDFMIKEVAYAHLHTDRAHIAQIALAQSIKAVPIIDEHGAFAGVVQADTVLEILNEEHTNYLFKNAGIRRRGKRHAELTIFQQSRTRIPWLIIGLFGGLLGAMIINFFEEAISQHVFIAAFIPAIVYIADAVGNQAEMLVVRALGRDSKFSLRQYLLREWSVGFLLSVMLGLIMFVLSFFWIADTAFSFALALSIVATVLFSISFTVTLPWLLKRLSFDPAVASGPIATVVCDVSSVTIYLFIAAQIL
ncbi:MAG: magnesium transporter [Candidatus Pacebacteria bacterium]|nr:magnesium transporter [Candidatus Paceibacterota bacterium]MBP9843166.1 magnesium transporter [Candidatus Paceibacterota bacterium]